jgi:hypothetical protein
MLELDASEMYFLKESPQWFSAMYRIPNNNHHTSHQKFVDIDSAQQQNKRKNLRQRGWKPPGKV